MENLYDYLPLLVILCISLISSINKAKKKKRDQRDTSDQTESDIEPVFMPENFPFPKENSMPASHFKPIITKSKSNKIQNYNPQQINKQSEILVEEDIVCPLLDTSNIEEVRRAVIYSELLAPKF